MSVHIKTGNGSPIDNNVAGSPACHYIDLDTGDHYLFGTTDWVKQGSGGTAMSVLTQDASTNASLTLDFTHSDVVLYNAPASGNITLDMATIDPTGGAAPIGQAEITVLSATPVAVSGGYGGAFVSAHDGITFTSDVLTPPAGALGMVLHVKQLGTYPGHGGNMVIIEASAFTSQTQVNM